MTVLGEVPPIVMISIGRLAGEPLKHTAANIVRTPELAVHLSDRAMASRCTAAAIAGRRT